MNARLRLIPFVLALAWGFNWPAVKIGLSELPPFTLRVVGMGGGALLLLLANAARGRPLLPPRQAWREVLVAGLLAVAVFNLCIAWAQLATSTSRAAVLAFTMPMMSAAMSRLWLHERLAARHLWALALGAVGVAVLAVPVLEHLRHATAGGEAARAWRGLALPLVGAAGWAAGTVWLKRYPVVADRVVFTAWQLLVGAGCAFVGAWLVGDPWPHWPSARVTGALVFHVLIGTSVAYWLWFVLIERTTATIASLTTMMVPVVGVLSAMALVGDRPTIADAIGFVLVLGGAALTLLPVRTRQPAGPG